MTAQFNDLFRYKGEEYSLAGISEGELFDAGVLLEGLSPVSLCSACWRGYVAMFGLSKSRLILDSLHSNLGRMIEGSDDWEAPEINGVQPTSPGRESTLLSFVYDGLDYHLEYTGGLLLADGFIEELYVHMGFHPAWKYENVIELIFANGVLQQEFDHSEQMAEIRQEFVDSQENRSPTSMPTMEEIDKFVERAFDRTYRI